MISNGSFEEETVEYKMELSNRKTMKIWGIVFQAKRTRVRVLKVLHTFSFSRNAPGRGSESCCSVTVTVCQPRPLQLPTERHRAAYHGTETNSDPGSFHHSTHTHQDHCSKGLLLFRGVLCNTGVCL